MRSISINAYAKINLGLRVLSRREDGYHDIITVMQRISLCDHLDLEAVDKKIEYCGPSITESESDNLCVKAAQAFQRNFGKEFGVRIHLKKNIPIGAGLGGGSSDAGAVLTGMSQLYDVDSQSRQMMNAAIEVGSDVPFFAAGYSSALVRGRGEQLLQFPGLNNNSYVLILWPGFEVSTALAYRSLDESLTSDKNNIKLMLCEFFSFQGGIPTAGMRNDFDDPIFASHPELAQACTDLIEAGAEYAGLSGSGSALYGVFDNEAVARMAASGWHGSWLSFVCCPY